MKEIPQKEVDRIARFMVQDIKRCEDRFTEDNDVINKIIEDELGEHPGWMNARCRESCCINSSANATYKNRLIWEKKADKLHKQLSIELMKRVLPIVLEKLNAL